MTILAGLLSVLGLLAVLVYAAQRLGWRPTTVRGQEWGLEVLARLPLAQRQGLAVVRFQGRPLLLAYGEGGVRLVAAGRGPRAPEGSWDEPEAGRSRHNADGESSSGVRYGGEPVGGGIRKDAARRPSRRAGNNPLAGILTVVLVLLPPALEAGQLPVVQGARPAPEVAPTAPQGSAPTFSELLGKVPSLELRIGSPEGPRLSGAVGMVLFIGFLALLPTLLLLMTSFTRILVVLHLLKQAIGTQTAPPAHLLAALALLLTGFVMAPTLSEVNTVALRPWLAGEMDEGQMLHAAAVPFRRFMLDAVREEDLTTFVELHGTPAGSVEEVPLVVVTAAFVTSELRHAFQMGFALFLPFVVIDIVVASVLMSMGMFMLPPVMVSLPFKLLLFVLVDGWSLVVGGLVRSFS